MEEFDRRYHWREWGMRGDEGAMKRGGRAMKEGVEGASQ